MRVPEPICSRPSPSPALPGAAGITSANFSFLTRSTLETKNRETMKWEDGKEYPVIKVEISSASHPFYTGKHKVMDTAGRIEKFNQRYGRKAKAETK